MPANVNAMIQSNESWSPLRVPIFRAVWIASLGSNFGSLIQTVGASWMMITFGASPQAIALVQVATNLPIVLLSLAAGAIADNFDRRKVMLTAQLFMLSISVVLSALAYAGLMTPEWLLVFTFLLACGTALNGPAWQASVGDMVPREILPNAVAYNGMGFNIARSTGPAVGGAIVAIGGATGAFLCNTLSYLGLIGVLLRWQPRIPAPVLPREPLGVAMVAGVRYAAMSPPIIAVLARTAMFGLAASSIQALLPLVARDLVSGGPLTYGLLLGGFGLGAVCGALSSGILRRHLSTEWIVRAACVGMAIGAAGTAYSRTLALTFTVLAVAGAGWVLALSTFNVSVQMNSPRWVVARSLALYQTATFGGLAAGSWAFGICASHWNTALALYVAAAALLLVAMMGMLWPLRRLNEANLDPQDRWKAPEPAIPINPRSGPIVITIEHRIAQENVLPFLVAMSERRRIRRRDGARSWTLLRDLGDPELWVERYHVPTWLDYVRHNLRRTQADAGNAEALRALRIGGGDAVVHRMIERQVGSLPTAEVADSRDLAEAMTDPTRGH